jgi:hypothetical protein
MARTGRYKWMPITGARSRISVLAFSRLQVDTPYYVVALIMYAFGTGLGFTMQVVVTAVQNSVDRRNMGVATASVTFFRSMGGAIGTALLGAILNIRLKHHLSEIVGAAGGGAEGGPIQTNDVTAIQALPEPIKSWVLEAFTRAMDDVFLVAVVHGSGVRHRSHHAREAAARPGHTGYRFRNAERVRWQRPRPDGTLGQLGKGHSRLAHWILSQCTGLVERSHT